MPVASFCVAFKGATWNSQDAAPPMVMQALLGSWDKAALGDKLAAAGAGAARQRPGELFMAFNTNYADSGCSASRLLGEQGGAGRQRAFLACAGAAGFDLRPTWRGAAAAAGACRRCCRTRVERRRVRGDRTPAPDAWPPHPARGLFARIDAVTPETVKATGGSTSGPVPRHRRNRPGAVPPRLQLVQAEHVR